MDRVRKIAFEEHYTAPGFADYSKAFIKHIPADLAAYLGSRLTDFEEMRLREMDAAGIERSVEASRRVITSQSEIVVGVVAGLRPSDSD